MANSKNSTDKKRKPPKQIFLNVTQQQVKIALEAIEKKRDGEMPTLREVQSEMKSLGFADIHPSQISKVITWLEDAGLVRRKLEVVT